MVQDVGVVAASVFEGVGEDRQAVEGARRRSLVRSCERTIVPRKPSKVDGNGIEGIANNVTEDAALCGILFKIPPIPVSFSFLAIPS